MKKLFSRYYFGLLLAVSITIIFFLPQAIQGKFPIPADALLNLYHPWREITLDGYDPGRFPAKNTLITDPILQTFPWRYMVINNLKSASWPLWNPYNFSGQPLLANIQSAPFQILNLLLLIFPFNIAWAFQIILPEILLTIFTFFFIKKGLNLQTISAVFCAATIPFTGFFVSWLTWGTIVTTAMWLPLILLSIEKIFYKKSLIWMSILIFSVSQTIFSGHWQTAFYVLAASFLYTLFKFTKHKEIAIIALITYGFLMGILISSIQILPSIEFINFSSRAIDQGFSASRQDWFLPLQNLIQIIVPDFFGNPTTGNYWGVWNYGEFVSYTGLVILFLAILAVLKRRKDESFFILLAIGSLLFALNNPISQLPYTLSFPLISSMQPSRIIFLFVFSLCVLSAFGLDYFLKESKIRSSFLALFPILILLVFLFIIISIKEDVFPQVNGANTATIALRNLLIPLFVGFFLFLIILGKKVKVSSNYLVTAIFLIAIFEVFRFGYKFTPFSKNSWIFPQTETIKFLNHQTKPFRVMTTDRRILHPNSASVYGIEQIEGYDPLYLAKYAKYISVLQSQKPDSSISPFNRIITPQKYDSSLIDLLNTKFILTFDEIKNQNFIKVFQEGETKTYLNKNALPRAYFVDEVVKKENDVQELTQLLDSNFNISHSATSQDFSFAKSTVNAQVTIQSYEDQRIKLKTLQDKKAPMILSNIYYPGWKAFIDGKEAKVHKVNFIFQSILIPSGSHLVEFKYQPESFYYGLYLSMLGSVITIISLAILWRKKFLS